MAEGYKIFLLEVLYSPLALFPDIVGAPLSSFQRQKVIGPLLCQIL